MKITYKLALFAILVIAGAAVFHTGIAQAAAGYEYKQCISNISYWYDVNGNILSVAQNCSLTNQACSNGACVNKAGTTHTGGTTAGGTTTYKGTGYIQNYRTFCYQNNVQWYDSKGVRQGIYQSCQDSNSCTIDSCADDACKSRLVCDGSTCAQGSADYTAYCAANVQGQTVQSAQNQTSTNGSVQKTTTVVNSQNKMLVVSLFGKKQASDMEWNKNINLVNNDNAEFLLTVKNTGGDATAAMVSVDLTNNIAYTGNLKIDGVASAGNVVSGIDLGSLPPNTSRAVYFTGLVQSQNAQTIQVIGRVTSNNTTADSDPVTLNITSTTAVAGSNTAAVSGNSSPFLDFVKKWYLWIIIVIVLIALFVIIFRRLSTNP